MKIVSFIFYVSLFISCSGVKNNSYSSRPESITQFSILQGSTDSTMTVLRLVYPNFLNPMIQITDQSGKSISIFERKEFKNKGYDFKSEHLILKNLNPENLYTIKVTTPGGRWKDERTFRTLKEKDQYRVLVTSCLNDTYNDIGNEIWPKAFSHKPDVSFLIGDNLYADIYSGIYIGASIPSSPEHLWRRHVDHAMTMKLYRMKHLVPTFVTWDDHDYGMNDGGKTYRYKEKSKEIFKAFFPTYKTQNQRLGHGVGSILDLGKQRFYFLDGRSFRDSKRNRNGYHLGKKQRNWLLKDISSSEDTNWLVLGDQFFGGYHPFESFEGLHPVKFKEFKNELKSLNKKYVFLSGDRHLIEVMKIAKEEVGISTIEYTVSGVHTKTYPGALKRDPNPRRVDGLDGKYNYGIFDISQDENSTSINFKGYSLEGVEIDRTDKI